MVLVHDTSSECALQMCEVSLKYLYNRYQVKERTRNGIANDQREITPKISKAELWFLCKIGFRYVTRGIILKINMQELWFLCMTHRLNVLYKCMNFR